MGGKVNERILGMFLRKKSEELINGECGLSEDEMTAMAQVVLSKKLYLADIGKKFNVTERTIERWVHDGLIPPLRKERGGKKYLYEWECEFPELVKRSKEE